MSTEYPDITLKHIKSIRQALDALQKAHDIAEYIQTQSTSNPSLLRDKYVYLMSILDIVCVIISIPLQVIQAVVCVA